MGHTFHFAGIAAFLILATATQQAAASDREAQQLVAMVIDAARSNFAEVKTVELEMREVLEDGTVQKAETIVSELPGGGTARAVRAPRMEWQLQMALRGDDLRVDRKLVSAGAASGGETQARLGGVWTQYSQKSSAAWIQRDQDLPKSFPIDPRQVGSLDIQRSLADILQESRIVSAKVEDSGGGDSLVRMLVEPRAGGRLVYEFAAESSFLPTRMLTFWPDGSILQQVDIEYGNVLGGEAKFLKKLTRRFFDKGVAATPKDRGWRQQLTREVVGEVAFNQELDDRRFQIKLPAGTQVSDNTKHAIYDVALQPEVRTGPRWSYTLALAAVLVALVTVRVCWR